ncbi:MAG: secretion system protein [SAR86 cluster bacterium]|uniref:Secretion system protein n=1 Tax=SAR86 cluster bacterium TaxID=2030880 RepID=A0A2A5CBL8_9GAMM|nr:MAG: secretion system protein [SAR86 cluster bacterium]
MPLYKYRAMTRDGKILMGNLDAANEADLENRLVNMRLDLIKADITQEKRSSFGQKKVEKTDLIGFCIHMNQLSHAGIPLLSGLTDMRDSLDHPRFKEVIANVIESIEGGKNLSEALADYPTVFDTLFVNLIRAGEMSGKMADVFDSLADMLKWQDELSQSTKKLIMGPLVVGTVVFGVTIFLMVYLVPQLVDFIVNMGETLPIHTRALIATSNFMTNFWYLIIPAPVLLFILTKVLISTNEKARYNFDSFKLKIPQVGPVLQKIILSRFASFFSLMYGAGIPILQSLQISEGVIDNIVIRKALQQAREDIEQGQPISTSFEITGIFPPLVIRMLKIGETTGGLDKALMNVTYFYDREIKDSIDKLQALIQPAMTAFVGGLLGWVMISVLGPVYSSLGNIQV